MHRGAVVMQIPGVVEAIVGTILHLVEAAHRVVEKIPIFTHLGLGPTGEVATVVVLVLVGGQYGGTAVGGLYLREAEITGGVGPGEIV